MTTDFPAGATAPPYCVQDRFSTNREAPLRQLLAWRDRLSHFLDVPVTRAQIARGFYGTIESYRSGDLTFMDCRTDAVSQTRTAARISTDALRNYVFHVVMEGTLETSTGLYPKRIATQTQPSIIALDLAQPMHMSRTDCRVLALFAPRALIETVLPEPEAVHGKLLHYHTPLARLIPGHLAHLCRALPRMSAAEGHDAMRTCTLLIAAAFGQQARLHGNARAAVRAAAFASARRFIDENLHEAGLSPERVLVASPLSRPTLYRMFEYEGGLAAYIRNRRLAQAAEDLRGFPNKPVVEIAYGLGFASASDFNRAFKRAFDMSPLEFRHFSFAAPVFP
ncbi:AraC-like DNA-binding protein [Paraburkholderia unamae]|uniref:helix-turn-helix domain-containing protein n=1 Tax=Paraburkholderia unamae TaxID=219649 RepID=UPI000DC3431C|nr:helix-turn-helix domain-containing protein [Paraburkholderia unamae]RAR61119.1 AraC-like DNA-binding protein [Paraburkholderia unamae]